MTTAKVIAIALALVACTPSKTPDQQFVEQLHKCSWDTDCRFPITRDYCAQVMNTGASSWGKDSAACISANLLR